jgi:acyl carrier protein
VGLVAALKRIIATDLDVGLAEQDIDAAVPLLEGGLGLDSIAIVELISSVEAEFGFQFQDSDLRTATFASVNVLAEVIHKRMAEAAV